MFSVTLTRGDIEIRLTIPSTYTRRVADDVFRIIAVRLLQPLVFESIQFSLTLFSGGKKMTREVCFADSSTR